MPLQEKQKDGVVFMTAPNIKTKHAFTTRIGGVSEGIWKSLNLGEHRGDREEDVRENYKRLCKALDIRGDLVFSKQVHGAVIRCVTEDDRHELFSEVPYEADGLITDLPDLPLIIFTADCIPVLLYDPVKRVIGAVHAGWRGTTACIVRNAVQMMYEKFGTDAHDIQAAIGPGICADCYETGTDVVDAVIAAIGDAGRKFIRESGSKFSVDLKGINAAVLEMCGVKTDNIVASDECTKCLHDKYWSHRYTHGERGSQASVIVLEESGI